jgi:hypothetical protein
LRRQVVAVAWQLPVLAIFSASVAMGATLDFEDLPSGSTVKTQYGQRGVIFGAEGSPGYYLDKDPAAHSGIQVLRTIPRNTEAFTAIPLVMTFTSAQAHVKLFAESSNTAINGTLTAFDAAGKVVAQDGPRLVTADVFTTLFEVTAQTPSITRVEFRLGDAPHLAIDDLEFDGRLTGLICPIDDADLAMFDRDPAVPDVVERWAPVIYQDIAQPKRGADLITSVDFDGNWLGADNASNWPHDPLPAVVYYSLVRTATHDFLGYYFYHAEDTGLGGHEHDMEGVVGALNRCTSELEAILTNVHGPYVPYVSPWSLERIRVRKLSSEENRPWRGPPRDQLDFSLMRRPIASGGTYDTLAVGIEAKGHAVWGRWHNKCVVGPPPLGSPSGCDNSHGGDGVIYAYTGMAEVPQIFNKYPDWHEYGYQLRDIATLWSMAQDASSCGQSQPTAIFACESKPPWDIFNSRGEDKGDLPWVWGIDRTIEYVCDGPNILLDPAAVFIDWFIFPPNSISATYKVHPYAAIFMCPPARGHGPPPP